MYDTACDNQITDRKGMGIKMELQLADTLRRAVTEQFLTGDAGSKWKEYYPVKETDRDSCFLWSYFAASGMLYFALKAGADVLGLYSRVVEGFAYYRSNPEAAGIVKYHSERGEAPGCGHGPCFFDDNIWVARNYLFAYEILKKKEYLEEACRIVEYIYTGWNHELGGLVWNENGLKDTATAQELERGLSANACCILVNAQLYRLTGNSGYLEWADRFYRFCKKTQDPDTRIYYNGVSTVLKDGKRLAGEVNRDLYGYNSGSMILADLLLFEITGSREYILDAQWAAQAAYRAFLRTEDGGPACYKDFIWFTAILAEGYAALSAYQRENAQKYMLVLEESLMFAWEKYRTEENLLPHDYVTGFRNGREDEYDRMLLTHSATAEIAYLLCWMRRENPDQRDLFPARADIA